jgi:hypothetical protein
VSVHVLDDQPRVRYMPALAEVEQNLPREKRIEAMIALHTWMPGKAPAKAVFAAGISVPAAMLRGRPAVMSSEGA